MWEDWSCWDLNAHMGNLPFTLPENKKATTSSSLGRLRGDITPPPSQPCVAKQRMQAQMVGLCFFLSRYETLFGAFPEQAVFWGGVVMVKALGYIFIPAFHESMLVVVQLWLC